MTPKEVVFRKNKSLRRVLYKIPACMDFKERTGINKSDMLTVVVEISVCNHIKVKILHNNNNAIISYFNLYYVIL